MSVHDDTDWYATELYDEELRRDVVAFLRANTDARQYWTPRDVADGIDADIGPVGRIMRWLSEVPYDGVTTERWNSTKPAVYRVEVRPCSV